MCVRECVCVCERERERERKRDREREREREREKHKARTPVRVTSSGVKMGGGVRENESNKNAVLCCATPMEEWGG